MAGAEVAVVDEEAAEAAEGVRTQRPSQPQVCSPFCVSQETERVSLGRVEDSLACLIGRSFCIVD